MGVSWARSAASPAWALALTVAGERGASVKSVPGGGRTGDETAGEGVACSGMSVGASWAVKAGEGDVVGAGGGSTGGPDVGAGAEPASGPDVGL